ncbi:MAG: DUF3108 domain-containing protein [Bacteroidaceae bacterium]
MKYDWNLKKTGLQGILVLVYVMLMMVSTGVYAQCSATNTAFKGGEVLDYTLYFNWKFVWMKAGTAQMTIRDANWQGRDVYQSELITCTNKKLDHYFLMRDTLQSVLSKDMCPLYYKKAANEGGRYYVDQVWYDYSADGTISLRQQYLSRRGETSYTSYSGSDCIYDMMSIMLCARSQDGSKLKKGDKLVYPMADGRRVEDITLVYRGKKNLRMRESGITYRCLIFSFVEYKGKKEKEIITFYITDDANHMPVRLDMFLKFGVAKAYLTKATGLRNACESIIKE